MALCEKCSATIPDGSTLCDACSEKNQPSAAVWSRPGSVPNSGNSFVESVDSPSTDTPEIKTEAVQSESDTAYTETAQPQYNTSGELDRRVKQSEFFNNVANVEQEQPIADISELFPTTNLLEVPYHDTEYNIGYNIPKMKVTVSKQTRRRFFFGTAIFSGLALVIAAFILLDSIFGIIPHTVETPVMYVKGGQVYLTSTKGKMPEQVKYDGTIYQLTGNGRQRIVFSPYTDDIFVISNYVSKTDSYSLYLRRDGKIAEQGVLIDSNIIGDFKCVLNGNGIVYKKGTSTTDLYFYDIKKGETVKLDRLVSQFSLLSDNTVVYQTTLGNIKSYDLTADSKQASKELVKAVQDAYFENEGICNSFFYIKTVKNTETGISDNKLFKYSDGESIELISGVDDMVTYSCEQDWAYCTFENKDFVLLSDFIEDDCAENDSYYVNNMDWDLNASNEMLDILRRENLRQRAFSRTFELNTKTLYFYKDGKIYTITDRCKDVLLTADGAVTSSKIINSSRTYYGGDGILYTVSAMSTEKIKFSEIDSSLLNYGSFISYIGTVVSNAINNSDRYVATDGKSVSLNSAKINVNQFVFSKDCKQIYYLDGVEDTETGELMRVSMTDKGFGEPESIAVDVKEFAVMADGVVVYIDGDKTAYAGSVAIANRVSQYILNSDATALALLAEASETGDRLVVFKDGAAKAIADSVYTAYFNDNTTLSYIANYDTTLKSGEFYICTKFNSVSRIDNRVSSIVQIKQ